MKRKEVSMCENCPCRIWDDYVERWGRCALGKWDRLEGSHEPDTCSHAAALKAVAENSDFVLVAVIPRQAKWFKGTREYWEGEA